MKCPDCGKEIKEIVIERYMLKRFQVDHDKKELSATSEDPWDPDDESYRCGYCDSLNIDELMQGYRIVGDA